MEAYFMRKSHNGLLWPSMHVTFIINGSKKSGVKVLESLRQLATQFESEFYFTKSKGHAITIAEKLAEKTDVIVSVGGDGTISECVNGVMLFRLKNPSAPLPAIALLPLGSGNDLARNFKWDTSVADLVYRLEHLKYSPVDIGSIEYKNGTQDFFINETSTGLSRSVVERVSQMPSYLNGNLKFGIAILRTFITFRKQTIEIKSDHFNWKGKVMLLVCANGKYFGSGIGIAPDADTNDGLLDITLIGDVTLFDYLKYLPRLRRCEKIIHPEVHYFKCKMLHLAGSGMLEKDGEIGSHLDCSIHIHPHALMMV